MMRRLARTCRRMIDRPVDMFMKDCLNIRNDDTVIFDPNTKFPWPPK